jgi:hypothetical protein
MKLSPNPKTALLEMIEIIGRLQDVYARETEALKASDIRSFMKIQQDKLTAARHYETGIAQILDRKQEIKTVDAALKVRLSEMQASFSKLAKENKRALERMQRTTNRLGEAIRDAAKTAIQGRLATSYTAGGKLHDHKRGNMSVGIQETA